MRSGRLGSGTAGLDGESGVEGKGGDLGGGRSILKKNNNKKEHEVGVQNLFR